MPNITVIMSPAQLATVIAGLRKLNPNQVISDDIASVDIRDLISMLVEIEEGEFDSDTEHNLTA